MSEPAPHVRGVVDIHTHAVAPEFPDLAAKFPWDGWPSAIHRGGGTAEVLIGDASYRVVDERCWSPQARLADMDREGVAVQVLSVMPVLMMYDAPPAGAAELAVWLNEHLASMAAVAPDRFEVLGTVPLQDPDAAVRELRRCVEDRGFLGVEIGTRVGDLELSDPSLEPFFAEAERLDALLFIHPVDETLDPRLGRMQLTFGVGMPGETAVAGANLLTSGIIEAHPALRICLAHGAGALPSVLGRVNFFVERTAPDQVRPVELARRLMCDSLTYDLPALLLAIERFGAEHVFAGSDYPFLARESPCGAVLSRADGRLSPDARRLIGSANARRLIEEIREARRAVAASVPMKGQS